jgi:hypothetical protein
MMMMSAATTRAAAGKRAVTAALNVEWRKRREEACSAPRWSSEGKQRRNTRRHKNSNELINFNTQKLDYKKHPTLTINAGVQPGRSEKGRCA